MPPRYLVFFKAPDVEAFNAAFKEWRKEAYERYLRYHR